MLKLKTLIFISILILSNSVQSSEKSQKENELSALKTKILKLKKTIEVKENSKSANHKKLRLIEKQIGKVSAGIRSSNQSIRKQKASLKDLESTKKTILSVIAKQNKQLSLQLYSAYTLGKQEQLKLLFSQQNAENLQRNLTYYRYFSDHRLQLIKESQKHFKALIENENKIITAKNELESVLSKQISQKQTLDSDRSNRKKVLVKLNSELKTSGQHLNQMQDHADQLRQLIDSLTILLAQNPLRSQPKKKFSTLKGKLSWPVKGRVRKLFGHRKSPSNLRWQGVVINAKQGNNVRAVSHGQVAFSDWLRGLGNLIIIDHGEGYLSLYGHNESLYKQAGEWVTPGEIIASIGESGGKTKSGVYFEIRRKGKPQNPAKWCKNKNWFLAS